MRCWSNVTGGEGGISAGWPKWVRGSQVSQGSGTTSRWGSVPAMGYQSQKGGWFGVGDLPEGADRGDVVLAGDGALLVVGEEAGVGEPDLASGAAGGAA